MSQRHHARRSVFSLKQKWLPKLRAKRPRRLSAGSVGWCCQLVYRYRCAGRCAESTWPCSSTFSNPAPVSGTLTQLQTSEHSGRSVRLRLESSGRRGVLACAGHRNIGRWRQAGGRSIQLSCLICETAASTSCRAASSSKRLAGEKSCSDGSRCSQRSVPRNTLHRSVGPQAFDVGFEKHRGCGCCLR